MRLLLQDLRDAGYVVDHIPADRQEFIDELIAGATNDRDYMSESRLIMPMPSSSSVHTAIIIRPCRKRYSNAWSRIGAKHRARFSFMMIFC